MPHFGSLSRMMRRVATAWDRASALMLCVTVLTCVAVPARCETPCRQFAVPLTFDVGRAPGSVLIRDVNGDGEDDVVVADYGSSDNGGGVFVLLGRGDGTFAAAVEYGAG